MSTYIPIKAKVSNFIEKYVLPAVTFQKDLDYDKVVDGIVESLKVNRNIVESVLNDFIVMNKLKKFSVLTIPDTKVNEFLEYLKVVDKNNQECEEFLNNLEKTSKRGEKIF